MQRSYNELGNYGSFAKPQEHLSDLSGAFDFLIDPLKNAVKTGVDYVAGDLLGIDTDDELYQVIRDTGLDVGVNSITSANTEKEQQAAKDNLVRQAEAILSQYSGMNCETMTDDKKREVARNLSLYTATFQELGMLDRLIAVIQKYNIPDCKLPASSTSSKSSTDGKKVLIPAVVGAASGCVAYACLKSVIASIAIGAAAGGCTYYFTNKGGTNVKA